MEKFLRTDADYLVVLEDDLKISKDFKCNVEEILNFFIMMLRRLVFVEYRRKKEKNTKNIKIFHHCSLWHAYYFPIRGLGLIWSRKGAEVFLQAGRNITAPVDIFFPELVE